MGVIGVLGVLIELRSLRSFLVDSELKELWEFLEVSWSSRAGASVRATSYFLASPLKSSWSDGCAGCRPARQSSTSC